jgi:hypothetical protein
VKKGLTPLAAWRIVCNAATVVLVKFQGFSLHGLDGFAGLLARGAWLS